MQQQALIYILFLSSFLFSQREYTFYINEEAWHTNYIIKTDSLFFEEVPQLERYRGYKYLEFGWGDADFFQYAGDFNAALMAKAILIPTPAVMKVTAYKFGPEEIFEWSGFVIEFNASPENYRKLLRYISKSIVTDEYGEPKVESSHAEGDIIYIKSKGKYHLLYTCNTWITEGMEWLPGVDHTGVTLTRHVLGEVGEYGKILQMD